MLDPEIDDDVLEELEDAISGAIEANKHLDPEYQVYAISDAILRHDKLRVTLLED